MSFFTDIGNVQTLQDLTNHSYNANLQATGDMLTADLRGAGTIRLAATGPTGASRTMFQYQSPHYTTRLSDLPIARVG